MKLTMIYEMPNQPEDDIERVLTNTRDEVDVRIKNGFKLQNLRVYIDPDGDRNECGGDGYGLRWRGKGIGPLYTQKFMVPAGSRISLVPDHSAPVSFIAYDLGRWYVQPDGGFGSGRTKVTQIE